MKRREDIRDSLLDSALDAIRLDKKDDAMAYVKKMHAEWTDLHDIYVDMTALLVDFIAVKLGEAAVKEAWDFVGDVFYKPIIEFAKQTEHEDLVQFTAATHRAHGSEFFVEEDEEKTVFNLTCCGSGGKLMKSGKLNTSDRHPMNHGTTKKAYRWSYNREGVPYYCIHSAVWWGPAIPEEWDAKGLMNCEWGRQFDNEGNPVNEPCKTIIYKKGGKP